MYRDDVSRVWKGLRWEAFTKSFDEVQSSRDLGRDCVNTPGLESDGLRRGPKIRLSGVYAIGRTSIGLVR
jgi:hypothetical protein